MLSNSMLSNARVPHGGEYDSIEVQDSADASDYCPLGHVEEDQGEEELEEFDVSAVSRPKQGHATKCWWWTRLILCGILLVAFAAVMFHWGVPFFLDKVIIPLMVWESTKFSKPVLAVILVLSLAFFPVFVFPSGPSMWLSGMMFGYGFGFLIIMGGTTVGQTLPYFIGRRLLHNRIQQWLAKYPKKAAVLRIAEQGGSFQQIRTIILLRVSPFPYPLFNYAVTATNIQYSEYIVGSILGMVPEAFITIYSGRLLSTLADVKNQNRRLTPVEIIYNLVGACVAVTVAVTAAIYGRRALQDMELREAAEREAADMTDFAADTPTLKQPVIRAIEEFPLSLPEGLTHSK